MIPYLRPLSFLYAQVVAVKNSLYDRGWAFQYQAPCRVVSIGNLTMGGTGKTPLTDAFVKEFVSLKKSVAVVSRSYRAQAQQPLQVQVEKPEATHLYGDEPVQLALANPQADFYVGPRKWQTAQMAVSQKKYDVLIIDDGFQHRPLRRDLDVVILDATEDLQNYQLVPEGRARESFQSLQRASVVVVTKCNWSSEVHLQKLLALLPKNKKIIQMDYHMDQVFWVHQKTVKPLKDLQGEAAFVVSAIGRPDVFEKQLGQALDIKGAKRYRDHHPYGPEDAKEILKLFRSSRAKILVTTEKDAVKLRNLIPQDIELVVARITVQERCQQGELHEILRQFIQ